MPAAVFYEVYMHNFMVILNYISVFVMIGCCVIVSTHESGKMQKLAMMVTFMLTVSCIGFLIKVEAVAASALITGQKLVYATVTHSMFLMLLFILEYCNFSLPSAVRWFFHSVNLLITAAVLTLDHHELFYKSYHAVEQGGYAVLEKDYGPLHTMAVGVFALYMAAAVVAAVIFSAKNKHRRKYISRLLIAVAVPCVAYIIPKLTGSNNDLQPVAFAVFTVLVLIMVYFNRLYDIENIAFRYSIRSMSDAVIVFGKDLNYAGCNSLAKEIFPKLKTACLDTDISGIIPVLPDILSGEITEYYHFGKIYSISLRSLDDCNGLVVWMRDITAERDYSLLLQEQKEILETQVVTDELTGIYNRRAYEEELNSIRSAGDNCSDIIIAAIDIDNLKKTNDEIGHSAGDELIKGAADVISGALSEFGKVFRTGGDEFFAVMYNPPETIESMSERLDQGMKSWSGIQVKSLSFSYGFARGSDYPDCSINELFILADSAMYERKHACGRSSK